MYICVYTHADIEISICRCMCAYALKVPLLLCMMVHSVSLFRDLQTESLSRGLGGFGIRKMCA